ncbi:glycosyltransferase family 4 protein [Streptomyces sp. HUAS MG91]|uniref:D-inositol 3-phosphate glycosyltransferase n=1 Tax=Streptomyces tabacisoli TaxID=3156398 RepID=A0AAU8J475_9ACTN
MSTPAQAGSCSTSALPPTAPDLLVDARRTFFHGPRLRKVTARADSPATGTLQQFLDAEYSTDFTSSVSGPHATLDTADITVARLRQLCRLSAPLAPEAVLAHDFANPAVAAVLTDMWPVTVSCYGKPHAEAVLRNRLTGPHLDTADIPFLLDRAESAGLRPLTADEAVSLPAHDQRGARHALWRYLHSLPGGHTHLPDPGQAADPYERLLANPPATLPDHPAQHGTVVAQTMLQGDLDTPGQGLSGGMSVLLGGLGDQLATNEYIGHVLTVVTAGHDSLEREMNLLRPRTPAHTVLRLPVDAPASPPHEGWTPYRAALNWWARRLFAALPRKVDVIHLRFGDEASLALADAAEHAGTRTVFTATPDPHRTLTHTYTDTCSTASDEEHLLRDDLHRIFCADRLVDRSDEVIGIAGPSGAEHLLRHFPVLEDRYGPDGPPAPPEGIAPYTPDPAESTLRKQMLDALYADGSRTDALSPQDRELPLLLSVGRLHPVKQQDMLVHTWLVTEMWRSTTLVIVGGSHNAPARQEHETRRRIHELLRGHNAAASRLAIVPAMPNMSIRRLERALADPASGPATWYVCPSAKEEFGIAILEAMEAGLPVTGPQRGGVAHYVHDGVNGLLLDTSSPSGLARGLHRLRSLPESTRHRMAMAAQHTATTRYALQDMTDFLCTTYSTLAQRPRTNAVSRGARVDPA